MEHLFHRVRSLVETANHPLLVAHRSPDGDTLGAMLAFGAHLDALGKPHTRFCIDRPAPGYSFMPGIDRVTSDLASIPGADLICTFDAGDLKMTRLDEAFSARPARPHLVNFDHHASNTMYGDTNVVMPAASSTAEVVYRYLEAVRAPVDTAAATCILTGLCTDTGNFTNPATNAGAMRLGAELIRRGAKFPAVVKNLYKNKSANMLQLWGRALERLRWSEADEAAATALFMKDFEECGVGDDAAEGISNFLAATLKAPIIMVLREAPEGMVRGSLRTVEDRDVSKIAVALGGGGHKKAAGFTVKGHLLEVDGVWKIL